MADEFLENIVKNSKWATGVNIYQERVPKRALGERDRQLLFERAHHKCEACGKRLDYSEMQIGHKTAWSRGGSTTLRNSVCLCYEHNRLQGTDSFATFMRKLGKSKTRTVTSPRRRTGKSKRRSSRS